MYQKEELGWNSFFQKQTESLKNTDWIPGRVAVQNRNSCTVYTEKGELKAEISGKLIYRSDSNADYPKVGDWVMLSYLENEKKAMIHQILERKTKFSRKVNGKKTDEQIIASNIDILFIVQSLDENLSLNRIERFLVMSREGGVKPVILINKIDLIEDFHEYIDEIQKIALDTPVIPVSAFRGDGMDQISSFVFQGQTAAFVGISGVGKSTLINRLLGKELQKTGEIRDTDSKGRHTTTRRELFLFPSKGVLLDTPGMKELQLWDTEDGFSETFADIDQLSQDCHFSDCSHLHEKKCAVLNAVENDLLSYERYENYLKMQKELEYLEKRMTRNPFVEKRQKEKKISKLIKEMKKRNRDDER
ncbi:MAG TPA: ribosome small subunit-dependent GTPase A [Spirochaetia bacterium]|nr:MAG: ribosome small subunit-dependent GTPase A [Spirochaetes bacterium GWB1_36_13]HCL57867.1 ribosome small subunit-dependent GTPase A [Spirochaetia bacterium]